MPRFSQSHTLDPESRVLAAVSQKVTWSQLTPTPHTLTHSHLL